MRRFAVVVSASLVIGVATQQAPPQLLSAPAHIDFSDLASWAEDAAHAVFPSSAAGSASGHGHVASSASTRAGHGTGSKPGDGAGALPGYTAKSGTVASGLSGHAYAGFNAKTSKFDAVKSTAEISVFDNADGTITKHVSATPVNFKNSGGRWEPIDTALKRNGSGRWQDGANGFTASFGGAGRSAQSAGMVRVGAGASASPAASGSPSASASAGAGSSAPGQLADVSLSSSESFAWSLQGAASVAPQVDGDTATYAGILPDTTLIMEDQAWGVRELLRLSSASAGNSWTFPLSMTGVSLSQASDGTWELVDGSGAVVGQLDAPWAQDSNFDPKTGVSAQTHDVSYSLATVGGVEQLTMTLSQAWLDDPARIFPVTVDPTVTIIDGEGSGTLTSTYVDTPCTVNCVTNDSSPTMNVGSINGTGVLARSFVKFPSADLVDEHAHVISAQVAAFLFWTGNSTDLATNSSGENSFEVGPVSSAIPTSGTLKWPGPTINTSSGDAVWTSADGWSSASACSDITNVNYKTDVNRWVYDNISDMSWFNNWQQGSEPYYGFFLAGVNDINKDLAGGNSWKEFASASDSSCAPYLSVTEYVEQDPQVTSMAPGANTAEATTTPTLAATATSADSWNPALKFDFTVHSGSTGATVVDSGWVSATEAGSVWSAKWAVPSGKLSWGQTYTWRVVAYDGYGYNNEGYSSYSDYPFSTVSPPPLLTTGLSQNTGGHGFSAALGNYTSSATDAKVAGYGPGLEIDRDYNSLDPRTSQALGAGWSSILDSRVEQVEDGSGHVLEAVFTYPDGSQSPYGLDADGHYAPPQGTFGTVTYSSSGGFTLTDQNDTLYTFGKNITPSGQSAQVWGLTSITNAQGQALTLAYDTANHVSELTGASGRHLTVAWQGSVGSGAAFEHVASIATDPVASGANPLTWTYSYTGDQLTSVCDPDQHCVGYTYQAGSEYQNAVLNSAAASYWPLDEASGASRAGSAVLANEQADAGTYTNVTSGVSGTPLAGSSATVAQFNGSSSQVHTTQKSIVSATGQFTVSAWVKLGSTSGVQDVVTEDGVYNSAFYLELNGGKWVFARVTSDVAAGSGAVRATDATAAAVGTWYFLAGTYDAGTGLLTLYVNGVEVGTATDNTPFAGSGVLAVGRGLYASAQTNWLNGDVSDVAVWNQDLSGVQIANFYQIGTHASAMLTSITNAAETGTGTASEKASYNTVSGRVTDVWEGGGEYKVGAPSVTGSSQVFASSVLGAGAAYYYRLNEGAGATSALNQVNTGSGTYNAVTLGGAGEFADASSGAFDGSSSYVSATGPSISATGSVSVGAWAKVNSTSGFMDVVSQNATLDTSFELQFDSTTGTWAFSRTTSDTSSPAFVKATGGPTVVAGTWYYLLGTYDGASGNMALYVNGTQVGTATDTSPLAASGDLQIGRGQYKGGYTAYFNGSISDAAVWRNTVDSQTANSIYTSAKNTKGIVPVETVTVTDPQSAVSTYRYDPLNGNREVSETDARGYTTTFGYDTGGFMHTVTDPNGDVTTTDHDVRGNEVSKTTCQNTATNACSTEYWTYYPDDTTAVLTTASPENNQILTHRAADSTSSTDATYETTYGYDNLGDQTKTTSPPVTTETYSAGSYTAGASKAGLSTTKTFEGETSGSSTITQLAYGSSSVNVPNGLLLSSTTPAGAVTKYSYYPNGDLAQVTSPLGETTMYVYDNLGRVSSKTLAWSATYADTTTPATAATAYTYNGENQVATETDPTVTDAVTGATHQKQTTNTYDADGNLTTQVLADLGTGADASRTTQWTYTPYDQVATETDPDTNKTQYTYYASGLKDTVTDPAGNITEYQYDPDGNLTTTILENYNGSNSDATTAGPLTVESRAYDPADRLASVTGGTGVKTAYTYYDNNLKASTTTVSADGTASYTDEKDYYDGSGNLTAKTTNNGAITTDYTVDAAGRVISSALDPTGVDQVTATTYFADGKPATTTATADGTTREDEYTYDTGDNVLTDTLVADGVNRVTTSTYDTRGLAETTSDPAGRMTTDLYDLLGQRTTVELPAVTATTFDASALTAATATAVPTTTTGYNTFGQQAEAKDADGNVTTDYFDADGNITKSVGAPYTQPGTTNTLTPTLQRTYTADGQLYQTTDPDNNVTTNGYDQFGHQTSVKDPNDGTATTSYNSAGQATKQVTAAGVTTSTAYDNLGRSASSSIYEYVTNTTDTTTNAYDWAGRVSKTTSPLGVTTGYGYDNLGETTSVTDGANNTTNYAYDGFGNVAKTTYPTGTYTQSVTNALGEVASTATYDSTGTKLSSSSAGYDLAGVQTSRTNALNVVETLTPDADGQIISETQPVTATSSITTSFGYDLAGNQTATTDGNGNTTYWTYNTLGLQATKTVPATGTYSGTDSQNTDYVYDADGQLAYEQQPGGVAQSYTYDGDGNLKTEYGYTSGTVTALDAYTYDSDGHMTSAVTCPDSNCATVSSSEGFGWNSEGEVTSTTGAAGASAFTYNNDGQMASRTDASGTTNYGYDTAGRLSGVNGPSGWTNSSYTYNSMDQVASITYDGTGDAQSLGYNAAGELTSDTLKTSAGAQVAAIDYGYDAAGQETSQDTYGIGTTSPTTDVANTYSYNQAGELASWNNGTTTTSYGYDGDGNRTCTTTDSAGCTTANSSYVYDARDELTSDGSNTYTYTANGNLATKTPTGGGVTDYTFNALGQETAAGATSYTYDGLGRAITSGTTALTYSGAGNNVSSDATATYQLDPTGTIIADQTSGGPISQTLTDTHDNLVAEFGSTATSLTGWQTYDPLGNIIGNSNWSAAVGYQSGYTSNGQVNMNARWYTPTSGQFNSADTQQNSPTPDPLNANPYAYANASPLDNIDPSGHITCAELWSCAGGAKGAVYNAIRAVGSSSAARTGAGMAAAAALTAAVVIGMRKTLSVFDAADSGTSSTTGSYAGSVSQPINCYRGGCPWASRPGVPIPGVMPAIATAAAKPHGGSGGSGGYVCNAACQALAWLHTLQHDSSLGRSHINPGSTAGAWTPATSTGANTTAAAITTGATLALSAACAADEPACADDQGRTQPSCDNPEGGEIAYVSTGTGGRAQGAFACLTEAYVDEFGGQPGTDTTDSSRNATAGYKTAVEYAAAHGLGPTSQTINACHLIGAQFGGTGEDTENLTTCSRMSNAWTFDWQAKVGGNMLSYESKVMGGLRRGQEIVYEVIPHYVGKSVIPDYWNMAAACVADCGNNPVDFDAQVQNVMTTYAGAPRTAMGINMGHWGITQ